VHVVEFIKYESRMTDLGKIQLKKWEIPDTQTSLDDLLYMLQVVQAAAAKGGSLTPEESAAISTSLVEKICRIKERS
jgi:hypothetical protein